MFSEPVNVNGHLVQAFWICKRQAWLLGHSVSADQSNDSLALGRLIDRNSYARERHQVAFGDNVRSDRRGCSLPTTSTIFERPGSRPEGS